MSGSGNTHSHLPVSRSIGIAFWLNLSFTIIELAGGFWTNSTAILADAVHDLGDSLALGLAWYLEKVSGKKGDISYSYGYRRFSVLGALISSAILILGSLVVFSHSIPRLFHPEETKAAGMVVFAVFGIIVNGAAVLRLRGHEGLNASTVAWHLIEDVLGWLVILGVSIVLLFKKAYILDPLLSILITSYVLYKVVMNMRNTLKTFLQGTPAGFDLYELEKNLKDIEGVEKLHHTHLWSLDGINHVFTTHVVVDSPRDSTEVMEIKDQIRSRLTGLGIKHTTIEVEILSRECSMETASCRRES